MLFEPTMTVCSNCVVRREHVIALDGFDPQLGLVEDVQVMHRKYRATYGRADFLALKVFARSLRGLA